MANSSEAIKKLKRARAVIKGQLTRIITYANETSQINVVELEARRKKLGDLFTSYDKVQFNIECEDETSDGDAERESFEKQYYMADALLETKLRTRRSPSQITASSSQSGESTIMLKQNSILPKVEIHPFDGNPVNWYSFYDTFKSLVHENDELPAVQKFHYLKNSLRGEVASIIASLSASAENYLVAWDLLQKRCNKPRELIQAHLKLLFELPEITKDTPTNLRKLAENAQVHVNALKVLKQPTDTWDAILIYLLLKKLDKKTRRYWERTLENDELPTFQEFIDFILKQARGEDDTDHSSFYQEGQVIRGKNPKRGHAYVATNSKVQNCIICHEVHFAFSCPRFLQMSVSERLAAARKGKLCLNCLKGGHSTTSCTWSNCRKCNRKHNTLLHINFTKQNNSTVPAAVDSAPQASSEPEIVKTTLIARADSEVLLGTAQIIILDKHNTPHNCRVLLDGGSQSNYITERLVNILQLDKQRINITTAGLSNLVTHAKYCVNSTIRSKNSNFTSNLKLIALPTITGLLPSCQINRSGLEIPQNINLADPEFHKPGSIDALLGNSLFYELLTVGRIRLNNSKIILQKTKLGWLVTGETRFQLPIKERSTSCFLSLDKQISKFWEIEEITREPMFSAEEKACEEHFVQNTTRDDTGRYVVRLPFNERRQLLGGSYSLALKRFYSLEQKLIRNPDLYKQYKDFLNEYESLNHMTEIASDDHTKGFYLPHHAVVKSTSATTKVRVVFDASAKSSSGISLNDALLTGPTIQNTLFTTLLRFRSHRFILTADIEKMFRQIIMHSEDTCYQKILWRNSCEQPVKTYELNTVTYGTAAAPFLAVRCLQQLAKDEGKKFPLAAKAFKQDFYVDDILTGASDFDSALKLRDELIGLAKLGGFHLRQWLSNDQELIQGLNFGKDEKSLCLDVSDTKKTLGIFWNPLDDNIVYKIANSVNRKHVTKRTILSEIAQLFDPLGLLGPVVIKAKILIQQLWKLKIGWDDVVPHSTYQSWQQFREELVLLNNFTASRKLLVEDTIECQLHGFCDASELAYGACIFIRVTNRSRQHHVTLLCAKSRVAPVKSQSLPRLELCAAVLLARLFNDTSSALSELKFHKIRFWSDSTIALHWIKTSPHLLKTFVANRVSEIQSLTEEKDWLHVSTIDNPADCISRGQTPRLFLTNNMWLSGPQWLSKDEELWPVSIIPVIDTPEKRNTVTLVALNEQNTLLTRFSSLKLLNKVVAYIFRFYNNVRCNTKINGPLTTDEIQRAHFKIVGLIQVEVFSDDINTLKKDRPLKKQSKIRNLNPFIDDTGLLRVGGRLKNAPISFSQKYPILLPRSHYITDLIIKHEHERHWHAGVQATLNAVRQSYWPVDGKVAVKHIVKKCIRCFRANPKPPAYLMGNLPISRVSQARPFENVGIDYCGPFLIKEKKERNRVKVKAYVAVFVCFVTKAIHLELVTDLTTEACLGAIRRFFARRGRSRNIYTDNATNFIGSRNELIELQDSVLSKKFNKNIQQILSNENVQWHFSPPRSPHFGGLWEAAVKSFKRHLYRTIGDALFTYELFNTFIIQIEAILNSRPLVPLSSDPNDLIALTPGHFLIGDTLTNSPEYDLTEVASNRLSLWQHLQKLKQHFWSRWHKEYLHQLHTRNKWHVKGVPTIKIGTLVTIQEENIPPMHWKLGRIVALHPGEDDIVRVVTVRTASGVYKRCVKKLSPLPSDDSVIES